MLMCIQKDYMKRYFISIFFSKWGKGSIVVNVIDYGRMMAGFFNSQKDPHQVKLLLRENMENPLECQKASIVKAVFTSTSEQAIT